MNLTATNSGIICLRPFSHLAILLAAFVFILALNSIHSTANASGEVQTANFAYSAEFSENESGFSIAIRFDGQPDYRAFVMDNPWRVVIELDGASFRLPASVNEQSVKLLDSLRFGAVSQSKSRLVLTLNKPVGIKTNKLVKAEGSDRYNLTLTFEQVSKAEFAKAIFEQKALLGSSGEVVVKGDRVRAEPHKAGTFSIVIDPGHGGIDSGSIGVKSKTLEKNFTLKMGKLIGQRLEKSDQLHVSYTRTKDVFVSLKERQRFARRQKADLMISIHADSLRQHFVRGATVYTLAKKATDSLSQALAESENLADVAAGLAAPEEQEDVNDILADLTMRETTRFSKQFSNVLVQKLRNKIKLIKNPQRAASFAVLKNAEVPSVLIEFGYLSNKDDEKLLSNDNWQKKVADTIAQSVLEFFATRTPKSNAN